MNSRKKLLIIILLSVQNCFAQIPDYFANNPTWHCGLGSEGFPGHDPFESEYIYYLNGDTIIENHTYHKVFRRGRINYHLSLHPQYDIFFNEPTQFFVRQVNRSIRFYHIESSNSNSIFNTDSLLVDYNYEIGDTVKGHIFEECGYSTDTIQKIDSVFINSEYRKVFYLDTIFGAVITEGIGHQTMIDNRFDAEVFYPLCGGIGFSYSLYCYGQNDVPLWTAEDNGWGCSLTLEIPEQLNFDFSISPNPASDYIHISLNEPQTFSVKIYDINGKLLIETDKSTIPINILKSGIYIINLSNNDGKAHIKKLVVNQ